MEEQRLHTTPSYWRKCSSCKKTIAFKQKFWVCNVSTCNRKRTGMVFCTVACWDSHVPIMNHRESWAEEMQAPSQETFVQSQQSDNIQIKKAAETGINPHALAENEILVVASKLKSYIRDQYSMNTAQSTLEVLSDWLRQQCDLAIKKAEAAQRKTVLDRDFE